MPEFFSRLLVLVSWDIKSNERADSRRREERRRATRKLEMDMCGRASQMIRPSISIRAAHASTEAYYMNTQEEKI